MMKFNEAFHQTLAVLTVIFNELCMGIGVGWKAPTILLLQKSTSPLPLTLDECSWIASLEHIGEIVGALASAFLLDIIGRKKILMFCSVVFFLQWKLILFTNTVLTLYVARIAYGIAAGLNDGTNSVYLGENSSAKMRGFFGTIAVSLYYFSMMIELIIATYCSYYTTITANTAASFLAVLSMFWMREPVQFLLMKGKIQQAEETFKWLRGVSDINDVKTEFENIKQNVHKENSKKSIKKIITSPANYKSLTIMVIIYGLAASTGYSPVMSYASMFFTKTDTVSTSELTVLLGIAQFLIVSMSSFIIDRFNRRSILLLSFSVIALSHGCSALLYYVNDNIRPVPYFPWLVFISISIFISVHGFMYPALFLIRSELFPLSIKAVGGCMSVISYAALSFLTVKVFMIIFASYGLYLNFLLFSVVSIALVLFLHFTLPETRNKSLVEIQEILEKQS